MIALGKKEVSIKNNTLKRKFFVVGNSRSGTTMLGRVLGGHSLVHTFRELHFFEQQISVRTVKERSTWPQKKLLEMLERLLTSARDGLFEKVISGRYSCEAEKVMMRVSNKDKDPVSVYEAFLHYESEREGKIIPCEQTPRYLFFANEILETFPDSKIINMVRDPRDVLLSQKNKWRRRFLGARDIPVSEAIRAWINYHPYTITRLWVSAVCAAKRLEKNNQFITLRFEDLLKSPENEVKALCKFIGIEFEDGMLNVPQVGSSIGIDDPDKLGIDVGRTAEWSKGGLTNVELAICQRVATTEMERLGYKIESDIVVPFWLRWVSMVLFGIKIILALLLNIRRSKNIIQSIRYRILISFEESK